MPFFLSTWFSLLYICCYFDLLMKFFKKKMDRHWVLMVSNAWCFYVSFKLPLALLNARYHRPSNEFLFHLYSGSSLSYISNRCTNYFRTSDFLKVFYLFLICWTIKSKTWLILFLLSTELGTFPGTSLVPWMTRSLCPGCRQQVDSNPLLSLLWTQIVQLLHKLWPGLLSCQVRNK